MHSSLFSFTGSHKLATVLLVSVIVALPVSLTAQQMKTPDLNEILQQLEANLKHYDMSVPSLFCDEHALSSQADYKKPKELITTDSIFRLRRAIGTNHSMLLRESREIKSVDGRPATSQDMDGPALLSGMFEGGLAVVSLNQASCMTYALKRSGKKHRLQSYVVDFATAPSPESAVACFLREKSTGRALIDPVSMTVTHLEIETPRHIISDGIADESDEVGKRKLTVDYAPVILGGGTFWLPSAISMRTTSGSGFQKTVWSFQATYRNFHREEVTSRVLPAEERPSP